MRRSFLLSTAALGIAILPLGAVQAQEGPTRFDHPGPYIGGYAGVSSATFGLSEDGAPVEAWGTITGFGAGGIFGVRTDRPPTRFFSLLFEAEFGFLDLNHNQTVQAADGAVAITEPQADQFPDETTTMFDEGYGLNSIGRVRVLFGAPGQSAEPFLSGGFSFANATYGSPDARGTLTGFNIGIGANFLLGDRLLLRPELIYDHFCDKTVEWDSEPYDLSVSMVTGRIGLIVPF